MSDPHIILEGVVGSQAYGLSTPDSDVDRLGIWQARTEDILSLDPPKESIVEHAPLPDRTLHELSKFVRLALAANPTVLELLWLDEYEACTYVGEALIDIRQSFLSQRARHRYIGYARSQVKRLLERGDFSSDLRKRTQKHGRHCARLLVQGRGLLEDHRLNILLDDDQRTWCFEMGELASANPETFVNLMDDQIKLLDDLPSTLPDLPDVEAINRLLVDIRLKDLGLG